MPRKPKLRKFGDITTDLEKLYFEMLYDHDMQRHEVIGHFLAWAQAHTLGEEKYTDGTRAVYYYGHQDGLIMETKKEQEPKNKSGAW